MFETHYTRHPLKYFIQDLNPLYKTHLEEWSPPLLCHLTAQSVLFLNMGGMKGASQWMTSTLMCSRIRIPIASMIAIIDFHQQLKIFCYYRFGEYVLFIAYFNSLLTGVCPPLQRDTMYFHPLPWGTSTALSTHTIPHPAFSRNTGMTSHWWLLYLRRFIWHTCSG